MKILALRGRNLASIPWFEIDLEKGVLSGTRIFAITGPTGAGKSTLLDTIALALYDRAPRFVGVRDTGNEEHEIRGADPRAVMRRHSAEAAAEVDFVGQDGVRYRATWEVWRAHRRATGRVQSQRVSLAELDTGRDVSGATKTETLAAIEARVGLSFDEFRRAVLLAQGDFAAFLEAKPDERAELLEKMTGTSVYAALSRAAFRRAKDEAARLEAMTVRRDAVRVLTPEDRQELETKRGALGDARQAAEAALEAAERAVAWHTKRATLAEDLRVANEKKTAALSAWAEAEADRTFLAEREEADRLAPSYRAYADADRRVTSAQTSLATVDAEHAAATAAATDAANKMAAATRACTAIQDAIDAAGPQLAKARTLDTQIGAATEEVSVAKTAFDGAAGAEKTASEALEADKDEVEKLVAERTALDAWIAQRKHLDAVAKTWARWETGLVEAIEIKDALASDQTELASLADKRDEQLKALDAKLASLEATKKRHAIVATELASFESALREHKADGTAEDIADAREVVARRIGDVTRLEVIPKEARRLEKERADAAATAANEDALAKKKRAERRAAKKDTKRLESAAGQAEIAYQEAEAVRTVAERRAELLAEGDPCPLCGATDHPYAGGGPIPKKAGRLKRKLKNLRADLERAKATAASSKEQDAIHAGHARAARLRAEVAAQEISVRLEEWAARREALALIWTESRVLARRKLSRLALQLPESPSEKRSAKAAANVKKALEDELAALEEFGVRGAQLAGKREHARAAVDAAATALREAEDAAREAGEKHAKTVEAVRAVEARIAERNKRRDLLAEQLDVGDDRRNAFENSPETLRETLEQDMALLAEKRQQQTERTAAIEAATRKRDVAQTKYDATLAARRTAEDALASRQSKLDTLTAERKGLLDGLDLDAFVEQNEATKKAAEAALALHRAELEEANRREAKAVANRDTATAALRSAQTDRATLELELEGALGETSMPDVAAVAARLEVSAADVEAKAKRLTHLSEEKTRAETTAADCAARLEAHDQTPVDGDAERTEARRAEARTKRDGLVEEAARIEERLAADSTARTELDDLLPQIEAQRNDVDRWAELSEIIGSSDGKKLRTFAQGLTLEVLLEQANLHLQQLRPRYRLRRVKGTDMELEVIDADMGDEVRAMSTLSGGERFLVSLALALGLSSLSSRNVKIESLFVDEGFGSLDRESLEVALATLDQLQSEGRTIGIISHMPEIAERIGYQIEVRPIGPGRSEVRVLGT